MQAIDKMVLRKMLRMKVRTVGISLVVAVAVGILICAFYTASVLEFTTDEFIQKSKLGDVFYEFSEPVNESEVDEILGDHEAVKTYQSRLKMTGSYFHEGETYPAIVVGIEDPYRQDINIIDEKDGILYRSSGEGVVVDGFQNINASVGENRSFLIGGQEVNVNVTGTVFTPEFAMAGYMAETSVPVPGQVVILIMPLRDLQNISGDGVNDVVILLNKGHDADEVSDSLSGLPLKGITLQKDTTTVNILKIGVDKMVYMFPIFAVIMMVVGFISITMTSYRLVMNDSRFIGVLMSLGYARSRIVRAYLLLGVVLAVVGSVIGVILGLLFTRGIASITASTIGSFELLYPLDPIPFVISILFGVVTVMISVAIPVIMITRTTVREALDYKPRSKVSLVRFEGKRLSRLSLMSFRNTFRNPKRFALTVLVIGITVGQAGAWLVMADSAWGYIQDQLESETWDVRADFFTPMPIDELNESIGIDSYDIQYYVPYSIMHGQAAHGSDTAGVSLVGSDSINQARNFNVMAGRTDLSGLVITDKLAGEIDAGVGDTITIIIGTNEISGKVTGIVSEVISQVVYTSPSNIASLFPPGNCSGIYIRLNDDTLSETVADSLRLNQNITKVTVKTEVSKTLSDLLDTAQGMLQAFFFISATITIVVSASAVIISTMERDMEFATMATLGLGKWKVAKSILIEMMILGTFSAAIGIPMAYLFAKILSVLMAKVLFSFPIVFIVGATFTTFIGGLIFVLLSSIFPIRYARKLDVERTIRERTAG
ncbi:MAG: ABC transporter permease [Thermoplasmatota archaeon]